MVTLIKSTGRTMIIVFLAFVVLFVSFIATDPIPNNIARTTLWASVYSVMTLTVVYLFQVKVDKGSMKTIGIHFSQDIIRSTAFGLGIGIATFCLILAAELAFGLIRPLKLLGDWEIPSHCIGLMIQGLISCLGIAIGEEVLYRGYLFGYLRKGYGFLAGIILSSIVFSAVHIPDGNRTLLQLVNIVAIGILLALISAHYKNVWTPIGFHWVWNLLEMYVFPVSTNTSEKGILRFIPTSGHANVGPENDILTMVIIIAVSVVFAVKVMGTSTFDHSSLVKKGGVSVVFIWILAFVSIIGIPKLLEKTAYEITTPNADELFLEEFALNADIVPSSNMASNQIMAPIAWTRSTGQDVTILQIIVEDSSDHASYISHETARTILAEVAPDTRLETFAAVPKLKIIDKRTITEAAVSVNADIVVIYQPLAIDRTSLLTTVKALISEGKVVIVRRDAAYLEHAKDLFQKLSHMGAICVGNLSPEGLIPEPIKTHSLADIYAPYGTDYPCTSSLVTAGVAALVIEATGYQSSPREIKDRLIKSGIKHYQVYDTTTGTTHEDLYQVTFEGGFRPVAGFLKRPIEYIALNAPRAVGLSVTSDWTLAALRIPMAQEISSGRGIKVAILGSGFQLEVPELRRNLGEGVCLHDKGYRDYASYQGTVLSKIVCSIAPSVTILPILIDDTNAPRLQAAIDWAVQKRADIILMAMNPEMNTGEIHSSIDRAVNNGTIVIWNSYEGSNSGVLKSGYIGETGHAFSGLYQDIPEIPVTYLGERVYAAAQLAGIAALIREVDPDITSKELQELIKRTASRIGNQYFPNVSQALESLLTQKHSSPVSAQPTDLKGEESNR